MRGSDGPRSARSEEMAALYGPPEVMRFDAWMMRFDALLPCCLYACSRRPAREWGDSGSSALTCNADGTTVRTASRCAM